MIAKSAIMVDWSLGKGVSPFLVGRGPPFLFLQAEIVHFGAFTHCM